MKSWNMEYYGYIINCRFVVSCIFLVYQTCGESCLIIGTPSISLDKLFDMLTSFLSESSLIFIFVFSFWNKLWKFFSYSFLYPWTDMCRCCDTDWHCILACSLSSLIKQWSQIDICKCKRNPKFLLTACDFMF